MDFHTLTLLGPNPKGGTVSFGGASVFSVSWFYCLVWCVSGSWSFLKYLMIRAVVHGVKLWASQPPEGSGYRQGWGCWQGWDTERTTTQLNCWTWDSERFCACQLWLHMVGTPFYGQEQVWGWCCFKVVGQRQLLSVDLYCRFGKGRGCVPRLLVTFLVFWSGLTY